MNDYRKEENNLKVCQEIIQIERRATGGRKNKIKERQNG